MLAEGKIIALTWAILSAGIFTPVSGSAGMLAEFKNKMLQELGDRYKKMEKKNK
jgi:hypothetical protein